MTARWVLDKLLEYAFSTVSKHLVCCKGNFPTFNFLICSILAVPYKHEIRHGMSLRETPREFPQRIR